MTATSIPATARWPRPRPEDLFSWPIIIVMVLWSLITHFAYPLGPGHVVLRVVAVLLAAGVLLAVPAAAWVALRGRLSARALFWVLAMAIIVGAAVRGAVLAWLLALLGADPGSGYAFRIAASVFNVLAVGIPLWVVVSAMRLQVAQLRDLTSERDRIALLDAQARSDIEQLDAETTAAVRDQVLSSVRADQPMAAQETLERLRVAIDSVVRPLSRHLERESTTWSEPSPTTAPGSAAYWRQTIAASADPRLISPAVICCVTVWITSPANVTRGGSQFALAFAAVTLGIVLPLMLVTRRLALGVRGVRSPLSFATTLAISALLMTAVIVPVSGAYAIPPSSYAVLGPTLTIVLGCLWALVRAAREQLADLADQLTAATSALTWKLARSRELHRQQRRALAHAVHGGVQATMAAGILQLEQAGSDGTLSDETVAGVRDAIVATVSRLQARERRAPTLAQTAQVARQTWEGLAEVTLDCSESLAGMLEADPQVLTTLADVVSELTFNAVRHGRARTVVITVGVSGTVGTGAIGSFVTVGVDTDDADPSTGVAEGSRIVVSVSDDGSGPSPQSIPGMGSRLLDDCAIEWSRDRAHGRTVTRVTLPFAPSLAPHPAAS